MKKLLVFLMAAVISFSVVNNSFAQTAAPNSEITLQDLGVENPGILPTSPFYFLKNISRGAKRFFTFDPIKKAELELNIANEQAAEIKKIREISPENTNAIVKAASNYSENVERLKTRLETIKETSKNPNVDKLINNLVNRSIKHQQLFEELKSDFQEKNDLKSLFDKNQEAISEAVAKVPEKFENLEEFKERLKNNIEESQINNEISELKAVNIVDKLESKLPKEEKMELESVKDEFIKKFEERVKKMNKAEKEKILNPEALENLSGDSIQRAKILKDIKEKFEDYDLEKKFEEIEEKIFEKEIKKEDFSKDIENIEINDSFDEKELNDEFRELE